MTEPVRILVRVQPRASRNKIVGFKEGAWQVRVAAPPVDGKANQELIEFLSDSLDVSKSSLIIEKGATGKIKTISVVGLTATQVKEKLDRLAANSPKQPKGAQSSFPL